MLSESRRLKIGGRSSVFEQLDKRGIFCGARSVATYRNRESIKREHKSLSTPEKEVRRCFFRNNEFRIGVCECLKKLPGNLIAQRNARCSAR
jgi:hypothetical protein